MFDLSAITVPPKLDLSGFSRQQRSDISALVDRKTGICAVRWERFDTHLVTTGGKYVKISGQRIYESMNHFARSALMNNLKSVLFPVVNRLRTELTMNGMDLRKRTSRCSILLGVPIAYGDVKQHMTKTGVQIRGGDDGQIDNWDIDNQWIWTKGWLDACQTQNVLDKDTVMRIGGVSTDWEPVPTMEDRHITFVFTPRTLQASL